VAEGDDDILLHLGTAAAEASLAEDEYRRNHAERLRVLERSRVFAYRRLNLVRDLVAAVRGTEDGDAAVAAAETVLSREFGLGRGSEAHRAVLDRFVPVIEALDLAVNGDEEDRVGIDTVLKALADFEAWYEARGGSPFLALYDVYVPQTPVVDF
jgi:hypothetical protein